MTLQTVSPLVWRRLLVPGVLTLDEQPHKLLLENRVVTVSAAAVMAAVRADWFEVEYRDGLPERLETRGVGYAVYYLGWLHWPDRKWR